MTTDLSKTVLKIGEKIPCPASAVLTEGDIIVPDVKPDVAKIMSVNANASIKKCERSGNTLRVGGTVFINILYMPENNEEEKNRIYAINTKFDFADEIPFQAGDFAETVASACVRHIDYSLLNSRKLNVKVYVGILPCAFEKKSMEFLTENEQGTGIEIKKKNVCMYSVINDTVREMIVSENIEVPGQKPDIGEALKMECSVLGSEYKLMTNKILIKGILEADFLYIGGDSDEELECITAEIPFSDVFDVEGITEKSLVRVGYNIRDFYFDIRDDINGKPRIIALEALLDVNIYAAENVNTSVIEDCYVPNAETKLTKTMHKTYLLKNEKNERISIREKIYAESSAVEDVYLCTLKPIITEEEINKEGATVKGLLVADVIAKTTEGATLSMSREIPFEYKLDAIEINNNAELECRASLSSKNCSVSGGEIELFAAVDIFVSVLEEKNTELVSGLEVQAEDVKGDTPVLVIYFVQKDDDMWNIAKKYKTTAEKIRTANKLGENDKICTGMKLLIPKI